MNNEIWKEVKGANSLYEHWYNRRDENGTPTRAPEDNVLKLLERSFAGPTGNGDNLSTPPRETKKGSGGLDLPDNEVPFEFENHDYDVIVGVIDTDLPLGHRNFRHRDGRSRVLAHWAMGQTSQQAYGTKYNQNEINQLLRSHSAQQNLRDSLDEDGFNRAIGGLDFYNLQGARGLGWRHSHGAHMLSMAGGADPVLDNTFSQKVGLITVSMPSRWEFGEAGEFLDQHMINAVYWLYQAAQAYRAQKPEAPVVTTLAFGRQAGSKIETRDLFGRFINWLNARTENGAPFDLVIPTGNDNINKVVARYELAPNEIKHIDWRIPPADQTDNYLEIWAETGSGARLRTDGLAVNLTPPGEMPGNSTSVGQPNHYHDIYQDDSGLFAGRVYKFPDLDTDDTVAELSGFLCALGPTDPRGHSIGEAQAGLWKISLQNTSTEATIIAHLSVQTDQSVQNAAQFSGRSYLDDETYQDFDHMGKRLDSVMWKAGRWHVNDTANGTRRHGTVNVAASQSVSAVVGGYQAATGSPALYSSTGMGQWANGRPKGPTTVLETDDSTILWGTLAAGSNDGSRVAMRGTSFAASKAARLVSEYWLSHPRRRKRDAKYILRELAKDFETHQSKYQITYDQTKDPEAEAKLGAGRVPQNGSSTLAHRRG